MATATNDKPVRLGDLPIIKTNILENAGQMDKGVVGGYNGTFPLTAASQGGIYLLPSTGKFYVCETAYNGAQISAPNSNFVELSVWKNHDRLNNLIEIKDLHEINSDFDFNKMLNFGIYSGNSNSSSLPKNSPVYNESLGFNLFVISISGGYITQLLFNYDTSLYIRVYDVSPNRWSSWKRL